MPMFSTLRAGLAWCAVVCCVTSACTGPVNNPYPASESAGNVLYAPFLERPKNLDPAVSYNANEYLFIAQIYEPPLQYHYLRRPYALVPLSASAMPQERLYAADGRELPATAPAGEVHRSVYEIHIQPGIRYQPHPAFARSADDTLLYHDLRPGDLDGIRTPGDFPVQGSRELTAADFVYQIKRMAHPAVQSPLFGLMQAHILGLGSLAKTLKQHYQPGKWLDLDQFPLAGAEVVDRYTYRIVLDGAYPQLRYWLAMPFFAPMAPEVDRFYAQPLLKARNLSLEWYPVGTGPYLLAVNDPNRRMELRRNPLFRGEPYPEDGSPQDASAGLLRDAGQPMPFIDRVVFALEREAIPIWSKFQQGYYDRSALLPDSFDQALSQGTQGNLDLAPALKERQVQLSRSVAPSTYYYACNMRDPVLGGYSPQARKLRRALAIAVDQEESIAIFQNGLGTPMQGPIPPGITGFRRGRDGINPYVYQWQDGAPARRNLSAARQLLAEAGYPGGRDARTGRPLVIHFDTAANGPEAKASLDWLRKQFAKLGVQLVVRATDYNRFQDKMQRGTAQLFQWGWNADYPDPENFLFLLYGPNAMAVSHGENASNYANPEFDRLFERMRSLPDGSARDELIDRMVDLVRRDAPWLSGVHPENYVLSHGWLSNLKPNEMANNTLKYQRLDPALRAQLRAQWNPPVWWPFWLGLALLIAAFVPAAVVMRRRALARVSASD